MYGVAEEQREKCENNPDIKRTGVLAMSGYIESTEKDGTVEASCILPYREMSVITGCSRLWG